MVSIVSTLLRREPGVKVTGATPEETEVSRISGSILWQLGGKGGTFAIKAAPGQELNDAGDITASRHDPEPLGNGYYSLFDNESADKQPAGLIASSQGDTQTERTGQTLVGWGSLRYVSEFDRSGAVVFSAEFPAGVKNCRAYCFSWA